MKIYIATDHAGYELKQSIKKYLNELGHDVEDLGAHTFNENDDYPDMIRPVAEAVANDSESIGIILGGSGQGEAMVANRVPNIRTAVYYGHALDMIETTRQHNNANILSLGARFMDQDEAKEAVRLFIETPFSGALRHIRRIEKI